MRRGGIIRALDPILLLVSLCLVATGILFIYSSGVNSIGISVSNEWIKQIIWAISGYVLLVVFTLSNHQNYKSYTPYIFLAFLLLLSVTLLVGREINWVRSWLGIGDFGFQPSEFAKLATILFLAAYLSEIGKGIAELPRFLLALLIVVGPVILILLQPDMGTAMVYFPIFTVMALIAGARIRHLVFVILFALIAFGISALPALQSLMTIGNHGGWRLVADPDVAKYSLLVLGAVLIMAAIGQHLFRRAHYYWLMYSAALLWLSVASGLMMSLVLKEYQIMRLVVFVNPLIDPRGAGWNIIQSVTAVGAGGLSGTGFLMGSQSHLRYLPQQSTDFIFSILAEESGFIGGVTILFLFAVLIGRGIIIMYAAHDEFATLLAAGIIGMLLFHTIVNIGMAIGILPITGIPLLFVSYGGSSLWTVLIAIGLLNNIGIGRFRGVLPTIRGTSSTTYITLR